MRSSSLFGLSWSLVAAAAMLACGGSQPAAEAPAAEAPSAAPAAEAPAAAPAAAGDLVWSDSLPTKDKAEFMKKKVMPTMTKVFKDHDAKDYAEFGCKTCHGPQMKPKPVDFLPTLHFKGGKLLEADTHADTVKFMHESVTPAMAELFGKPAYDPATKQGFGCGGCHKVEM